MDYIEVHSKLDPAPVLGKNTFPSKITHLRSSQEGVLCASWLAPFELCSFLHEGKAKFLSKSLCSNCIRVTPTVMRKVLNLRLKSSVLNFNVKFFSLRGHSSCAGWHILLIALMKIACSGGGEGVT